MNCWNPRVRFVNWPSGKLFSAAGPVRLLLWQFLQSAVRDIHRPRCPWDANASQPSLQWRAVQTCIDLESQVFMVNQELDMIDAHVEQMDSL